MTYEIQPVILCGGAGTRLWPASRGNRAKQFLPLTGERARDMGIPGDMMTAEAADATGTAREIPPRSRTAFRLAKGETPCVIDPLGDQVSDFLAFMAADVRELISNGRTFDYEETIRLTTGHRLWSNRSNAMLEMVEDTVGLHDFF